MKKRFIKKISKYQNLIITLLVVLVISLITIGYALYGEILYMSGFVTVQAYINNSIEVKSASFVSGTRLNSHGTPTFNDLTATFPNNNFNVTQNNNGIAVYTVEINNNTSSNYVYEGNTFTPNTTGGGGFFQSNQFTVNISGIQAGEELAPGDTKVLTVTFTAMSTANTTINASPVIVFNFSNDNTGSLLGSLTTRQVNLRDNNTAVVNFSLINTFQYERTFAVASSNSNFSFVDSNGDDISSLTIANGSSNFSIYIKSNDGASFLSDSVTTDLIVTSPGISNINVGTITILVEEDLMSTDTLAPQIGPIILTQASANGKINITWSRVDSGGTDITNYTILLYNSNNSLIETINTGNGLTSYTTSSSNQSLGTGTYYVIIYGADLAGNSGSSEVGSATESTTNCRRSPSVSMQWIYNVDISNVSNLTFTGESTIAKGANYMASLAATSGSIPSSITITMGGTDLTTTNTNSSYYTYSSSSGAIVVYNVQGDLVISATGSCFAEGTLITLADGTKKKIEDVNYSDLLLVWDFEHGEFTYEYPIWIEKEGSSDFYQITSFSDGTSLKTVNYHGIFSLDRMMFVNIDNKDDIKIGSRVVKVENNQFKEVQVTNIEYVYNPVKYYQVVTSTYYNVIGDDVMTTDGNVMLVNLYGFNNDLTWKVNRQDVIKDSNNLFPYDLLKSVMPYYMFVGLRASEVKYISNLGYFTMDDVPKYMDKLKSINSKLLLNVPVDGDNNRLWMVTTSDDVVSNKDDYMFKEGSIYTLKEPNIKESFAGWYNTSDGKIYNSNDEITIFHGTHFIAYYK